MESFLVTSPELDTAGVVRAIVNDPWRITKVLTADELASLDHPANGGVLAEMEAVDENAAR